MAIANVTPTPTKNVDLHFVIYAEVHTKGNAKLLEDGNKTSNKISNSRGRINNNNNNKLHQSNNKHPQCKVKHLHRMHNYNQGNTKIIVNNNDQTTNRTTTDLTARMVFDLTCSNDLEARMAIETSTTNIQTNNKDHEAKTDLDKTGTKEINDHHLIPIDASITTMDNSISKGTTTNHMTTNLEDPEANPGTDDVAKMDTNQGTFSTTTSATLTGHRWDNKDLTTTNIMVTTIKTDHLIPMDNNNNHPRALTTQPQKNQ
jgi:hypothetical protein